MTINNIRRKLANAISPEQSNSYPFVGVKWSTIESENRRALKRAHKKFEEEHGRPAKDNAEAWRWDREELHKTLNNLGLEPSNPSTDFIPEHFEFNE